MERCCIFLLNFYQIFSQRFSTNFLGYYLDRSLFRLILFRLSVFGFSTLLLFALGGCSSDNSNASKVLEFTSTPSHINLVNQTIYDLSGTCTEAQAEIGVRIGDLAEFQVPCKEDLTWEFTGLDLSSIQDGQEVAVIIRQGDNATQSNGLLLELTVIKDTILPTVSLGSLPPISTSNQSQFTLGGLCSEEGQTISVLVGDLPEQTATCESLAWTLEFDISALITNTVLILVDSTDAAGNPATQVSITMNRDFSAPRVAFTSTDFNITSANQNSYSLEGTCDLKYSVNLIIGSLTRESLNCSNNGVWELTNKNVSTLPDGPAITIRVEQQNPSSGTIGFTEQVIVKDTVHPAPTLTTASLFVNASNKGSYSLEGGCDGSENVSVTLGSQNTASTACSSRQWSYSVSLFFIRRLIYAGYFPKRHIR